MRTGSQVDSDAGFGLPGCHLRPSGQCSYETGLQLQRITRSARSRPSLHGLAREQRIRTHSSSGEQAGRGAVAPASSPSVFGLLLGRRVPLRDACCGGGSAAKRRRRTMGERDKRTFAQLKSCGGVCRACLLRRRRLADCASWPRAWSVCWRRAGGAPKRCGRRPPRAPLREKSRLCTRRAAAIRHRSRQQAHMEEGNGLDNTLVRLW